jgi:acyl-CoA synthetase (AMP-forming)/AMP-acid ligase II
MTPLIDALLLAFETRFGGKFSEDVFGHFITTRFFLRDVKYYFIVLRNLKAIHGPQIKIALLAGNTQEFIACYIALIMSNLDFHLIPSNVRPVLLSSIISGNDINFVFTDKVPGPIAVNSHHLPFFKGVFDITVKSFKYLKSDKAAKTYDEINQIMYEAMNEHESSKALRELVYDEFIARRRETTVYSSGVGTPYVNAIAFSDEDIFNAFSKLAFTDALPELYNTNVNTTGLTYSYAPIWSILWPIVSGGIFCPDYFRADVIILSSGEFEKHWKLVTEDLYEKRFIGKLLTKDWLYWLFKWLTKRRLDTYFNSSVKKKAIIIMNAFMPPRINDTITNLPVYTTYGMQEMNHVVTVNDRSTKALRAENCVGRLLEGISGEVRDKSLVLCSPLISDDYKLEKGAWYDTRDQAHFDVGGLLFVYGKMKFNIKTSLVTYDANRENLERIMRNIPYFADVLCFQDSADNNHLLIYPNPKVIEAMQYGMLDFMNLIKPYLPMINDRYDSAFLSSIKLVFSDFIRTHTGKIHKELYLIASRQDKEKIGL